jgi:CubicO group peptidase (beta-lactamase class C family)
MATTRPFWKDSDGLSNTLSMLAGKHRIPGAQLAIHHGGETVAIEVGELEYGTGCRVTPDSAFPIGSVSKAFTATVAMILVADGDLELDVPLNEYTPELDGLGNELTLRHILSHTAGLAAGPRPPKVRVGSIRRYVLDHCLSENLLIPPGAGFSYSNMGYVLAGYLIEIITGMSWWDAVASILLRRLKVEPTFIGASGCCPPGRALATGHSVNVHTGRTRPVMQSLAVAEAPAGGLAVSASDLVSFGMLQFDRSELLSAAYTQQMQQIVPHAEPFGLADGWGLGLAMFRCGNTAWVGHDGNADGTACYLRVDPVGECVVAFTSNAQVGLSMWRELVDELGGAGLSIANCANSEALGRPRVPPPDCVGRYLNGDIEYAVVATGARTISIAIDRDTPTELIVFDDLTLAVREQPSIRVGRLLHNEITGEIDLIQVGGILARRQSASRENAGADFVRLLDVLSSKVGPLSTGERT